MALIIRKVYLQHRHAGYRLKDNLDFDHLSDEKNKIVKNDYAGSVEEYLKENWKIINSMYV